MKCYLINLDRSMDRLAKMQVQFDNSHISFKRISGVDGKTLTPSELSSVINPVQAWEIPIPASEIGCFLSHKKCLELIASGEDGYGVVFEDDVTLSGDSGLILNDVSWIPVDADVIKLDTNNTLVGLKDFKAIDGKGRELARLCDKHLCCGGYIVSQKAAKRILSYMDRISVPVDNLIYDPKYELFSALRIYQLTPALCMQIDADSLIEADRRQMRREHKKRPSLPVLIWRELSRPYKRNAHIISPFNVWARLTTTKRWMKVPFKL